MADTKVKLLAALAAAVFMTSCHKEPATLEGVIDASLPHGTKVSMNPSERGLALSWQAGDELAVCADGRTVKYSILEGFTAHEAKFSGELVSGDSFSVWYPGKYGSLEAVKARAYDRQLQNGNGNTAHLEWNAIVENTDDYLHLDFARARRNGVLNISVVLPDDVASVEYVELSADSEVFYVTNDSEGPMTDALRIDLENVDMSSHVLSAYMMTVWHDTVLPAGTRLRVTVGANKTEKYVKRLSVPAGGIVIESGKLNIIRLYQDATGDFASLLEGFVWSDNNFWE